MPRTPATNGTFEAKAKTLVAHGKRLDQAIHRVRKHNENGTPLKAALADAMREWRDACRQLAGEEPDDDD